MKNFKLTLNVPKRYAEVPQAHPVNFVVDSFKGSSLEFAGFSSPRNGQGLFTNKIMSWRLKPVNNLLICHIWYQSINQ